MTVKKQDVINRFNATNVKQIDNKQLFIADVKGLTVLISYSTVVGYSLLDHWYITTKQYSRTTSKQLTDFKKQEGYINCSCINQLELDNKLKQRGI